VWSVPPRYLTRHRGTTPSPSSQIAPIRFAWSRWSVRLWFPHLVGSDQIMAAHGGEPLLAIEGDGPRQARFLAPAAEDTGAVVDAPVTATVPGWRQGDRGGRTAAHAGSLDGAAGRVEHRGALYRYRHHGVRIGRLCAIEWRLGLGGWIRSKGRRLTALTEHTTSFRIGRR